MCVFDEIPVRLVLLAPFKGGNVRTKEREGDLSKAGYNPAEWTENRHTMPEQ